MGTPRIIFLHAIAFLAWVGPALGDDFIMSAQGAGPHLAAAVNAVLANNGSGAIIFDADAEIRPNFNINNVSGITVSSGVTATINFLAASTRIIFIDADANFQLNGNAVLNVQGASGAAGFDFASVASGRILTFRSSSASTLDDNVPANRIILGVNNTFAISASGNTNGINKFAVAGDSTIRFTEAATVRTLTLAAPVTLDLDTDDVDVTITNAVSVGANKVTLVGSGGGTNETLNATLDLDNAASELEVSASAAADLIDGTTINVTADGATLDINNNFAPTAVAMSAGTGDLVLETGANTLSTTIEVNDNTLTISEAGAGVISTVRLDTAGGVVDLNTAKTISNINMSLTSGSATLRNGATLLGVVTAGGTGGTLIISETGAIGVVAVTNSSTLDVDESFTAGSFDMNGDGSVDVAPGKTLTVTNGLDTNANTLALTNTGTLSRVDIDGAGGTVRLNASSATITTLNHTAAGTIDLNSDGCNLTVTNDIVTGDRKLSLSGSGGGAQESLTATVDLSGGASAELEVTGADADNIAITEIDVSVDGATLDANIDLAPTLIDMNAGQGDLTLQIAANTLTTNIDVNDNTLTISEVGAGTISTVTLDSAGGVVDLNTAKTITNLNATLTAGTATLQNGTTLSGQITVNGNGGTLQTAETGSINQIQIDTNSTLDVDDSLTVTTCDMIGNGTVDVAPTKTLTITNGLDTNSNSVTLSNTGTIPGIDIDGAGGTVRLDAATATVTTLNLTAAGTIDLNSDGCNLSVTNDIVTGNRKLSLSGSGGGAQESLTATVNLSGGASAELEVTGADADNIVVTEIDVSVDGATLDANADFAPTLIDMNAGQGDLTLQIAANTLTTSIDVNDNTLTITQAGAGTISTASLDSAGGAIDLNTAKTITNLNVTLTAGTATIQNGGSLSGLVTVNGNGGTLRTTETGSINQIRLDTNVTLDVNESCTVTTCDMLGSCTVDVAPTKTLSVTNGLDTNSNTLSLSNTGRISRVDLDGAGGIVRLNAATAAITTLNYTADGTIDLNSDGCNLTVTNDIVTGNRKLSLTGSGGGAQESLTATVDLSGGASAELEVTGADADNIVITEIDVSVDGATLDADIDLAPTLIDMNAGQGDLILQIADNTLTTNIDVNNNTLTITEPGAGTISRITLDSAGGVVDLNTLKTITNLNATLTAGTATLQNGVSVAGTVTVSGAGGTLRIAEAGTIADLDITGNGTLDVDETLTISDFDLTSDATLDVLAGKTLTATNSVNVANNTLTLTGSGTISRLDATTGSVIDNAGSLINDLRPLPGAGNTFTWGGTGNATVTISLAGALGSPGNIFRKTGTGRLSITSGVSDLLDNATGVRFSLDDGETVVGSSGSNDDINFDDDADTINLGSSATLTTFGSYTVGVAGANVNLYAATGSTINLSSNAGAETVTALANIDYQILGTVNINGADSDYTLGGSFHFNFADVNINTTGSFIFTELDGRISFLPGSTVTMNGSAVLTLGSSIESQEVRLDTITQAGVFTISRMASTNLTLFHLALTRAKYASTTTLSAVGDGINLDTVDLNVGTVNWRAVDPLGAGGSGVPDEPELDPDSDSDSVPEPEQPAEPELEPDDPCVSSIDTNGASQIVCGTIDVMVSGAEEGATVSVVGDEPGHSVIAVSDSDDGSVVVTLDGFLEDVSVAIDFDLNGDPAISITDADEAELLNLVSVASGNTAAISIAMDEQGNLVLGVHEDGGRAVSIELVDPPTQPEIVLDTSAADAIELDVLDQAGELSDLSMILPTGQGDVLVVIIYTDGSTRSPTSQALATQEGVEDGIIYAGPLTVSASGLAEEAVIGISLFYMDADILGIDESALRLHQFDPAGNRFKPAGSNDVGLGPPSAVMDDLGLDMSINQAWAEVATLGKFAVGIPALTEQPPEAEDEDLSTDETLSLGSANGALCGAVGSLILPATILGMVGLGARRQCCGRHR